MKVALLITDKPGYEFSFGPVGTLLCDHGHEVLAVYPGEPPRDQRVRHANCDWENFELSPLLQFCPHRIVVFNGYHDRIHAATRSIERLWKVLYFEHAWLPQAYHNTIDRLGPGVFSSACRDRVLGPRNPAQVLETLRALDPFYVTKPINADIAEAIGTGYILVPLQLEFDTSIRYGSPIFKSNRSLLGFVKTNFADFTVVVKPHPLDKNPPRVRGVFFMSKDVPFNDLVPNARAIVGINSTTMIEALVHKKPVLALGRNVASNKGVYVEGRTAFENPRTVLSFQPDPEQVERVLDFLFRHQFDRLNPPKWVEEYIIA